MSTAAPQPAAPKPPAVNRLGLPQAEYKGAESTLCAGCGHDSITSQLVKALFEMDVEPYNVAKMSGIGCSSKTTAYFLGKSHGFNGVHGRMPAMTTGSYLANRKLVHVVCPVTATRRRLVSATSFTASAATCRCSM